MSWETKRLGDVVKLRRGFDLPTANRVPGPYPVLSAGHAIGSHNAAMVSGPGFAVGRATNLGKPVWSDPDFWPLNTTLFAEDFMGNNTRWLFHLFETLDLTGFNSGSAQPMLNRNYIANVPVRVPPRHTQDAIAEVLGALDDKIAANHRLHRLAIDQISALAREAAGTVRLGEVASLHRNSLAPDSFGAENVWHYSLPSFDEGKVRLEASSGIMSAKHRLDRPVVLVSKLNPRIPRVWPVMRLKEGVSVTSPEFMAMAPTKGFSVASLTAALRSEQFTASLLSLVAGTTGSHQRVKPMEVMELGIPDMRTLSRAALETIEALELMSVSSSEENTALARTRDELLPQLMSGRITVKDAEKRVEEEV